MTRGRNPLGLVDVLQADRDTMQGPAPAPRHDLGFRLASRRERLVAEHTNEGVELAVEPLDACQAALRELHRREVALGDQRASLCNCQEIRDHRHSSRAVKEPRTRLVVSRRSAWITALGGSPGGGKICAGSAAIVRLRRRRAAISSMKCAAAAISGFSRSGILSPARASAASTSAAVMPCVFTMCSPLSSSVSDTVNPKVAKEKPMNGWRGYSVRMEGAKYGVSFGSALAMAISYTTNHSILWAIVHGIFSWIYVVYFALFYA